MVIAMLAFSQAWVLGQKANSQPERPRLVVGIVVDQMRYDYLYRFMNKYGDGGFKRLLKDGFSCENTMINYIPSVTAIGHTTIFTGSVPSIHGIAGNDWIDYNTGKSIYCSDDKTVKTVGAKGKAGQMSPRNLLVTTITDELRLGTNFKSKVVGVSLKDRAAIMPAGHKPTGAYWMDDATGRFITSSYYMDTLPEWVSKFNDQNYAEKLVANGWNTLLPIDQYTESTADNVAWEGMLPGATRPAFPFDTKKAYEMKPSSLRQMPFGNTLTLMLAKAAIDGEKLGQPGNCDFLTINCASTDYVGHMVGPNAIEVEDVYLRLDRDLSDFFAQLDKTIGKGKYLVFLTADHGAAHAQGFMAENNMPAGFIPDSDIVAGVKAALYKETGDSSLVLGYENFQLYLNTNRINAQKMDVNHLKSVAISYLRTQPSVQYVVDQDNVALATVPAVIKEKMVNGYNWERSGQILVVTKSGWLPHYCQKGCTHSVWNPYDTHIPLVFMGWKIKPGYTNQETYMTDISATLAALLHLQMPSGCIGKPILKITGH